MHYNTLLSVNLHNSTCQKATTHVLSPRTMKDEKSVILQPIKQCDVWTKIGLYIALLTISNFILAWEKTHMVERLSIKETTIRNWQYINIECISMLFLNHIQCWARVVRRLHGKKSGLAHERKYVANNCQCTIAANACCMVLYVSNLVHLVGCVCRKTLLSHIRSTICKINVCFRANNVCFADTWQSSTIEKKKKKTFPWTQCTPLQRQFVERTAAWFWSHWLMVPK